jgi:hypothetical protein
MDPVILIVTALGAGAKAAAQPTALTAVVKAYASLTALVARQLTGRHAGQLVLARHADGHGAWEAPLAAELTAAGAAHNTGLITAAQALMGLVDTAGATAGAYTVDPADAPGASIPAGAFLPVPARPHSTPG